MKKTLMLTLIALSLGGAAFATMNTASALGFRCATTSPELAPVVRTCNYLGSGGAQEDLAATVAYGKAEASELIGHEYVSWSSGAHHCATTSEELVLVVRACNYVLGGGVT